MNDLNYTVKTHKLGRTYNKPHFFIQNKGLNSGKPMKLPCPNCFVVTTESNKELESLYYLCFSLKVGAYFSFYLVGSVIPFLRINDAKLVICKALKNYEKDQWHIKAEKLKKIVAYEQNLEAQLKTIAVLKLALLKM